MKKLILTEAQLENLKGFLNEEEGESNDSKKIKETLTQIKMEFTSNLADSQGNYVSFIFGDADKEGEWDNQKISVIVCKIKDVEAGRALLSLVTTYGTKTQMDGYSKDTNFIFYANGTSGMVFKNQKANVSFLPVKDNLGDDSKGEVFIPNFLSYLITPKGEQTNAIEIIQKGQEKWKAANEKFNKETQYKPGFLGMDNFFFFPKGYMAMDDIFKKFGIQMKGLPVLKIKIKNTDDIKGGGATLNKGGEYTAEKVFDGGNLTQLIVTQPKVDFIFYTNNQVIVNGADFNMKTFWKPKKVGDDEKDNPLKNHAKPIENDNGIGKVRIISGADSNKTKTD